MLKPNLRDPEVQIRVVKPGAKIDANYGWDLFDEVRADIKTSLGDEIYPTQGSETAIFSVLESQSETMEHILQKHGFEIVKK